MPIYIFEKNAFDKMIKVEGEEYRRVKSKEEFGDCSFDAFFEEWKKDYAENSEARNFKPEFGIRVNGNGAIYGLEGWNRYAILNSGEMVFIRSLAKIEEYIKKAKKTGFRLW